VLVLSDYSLAYDRYQSQNEYSAISHLRNPPADRNEGWSEMKPETNYIPHKKDKGKKGALAKIINKFRPKSKKREPIVWKEDRECDGWNNFLKGGWWWILK